MKKPKISETRKIRVMRHFLVAGPAVRRPEALPEPQID
jgi:hypothetical protein